MTSRFIPSASGWNELRTLENQSRNDRQKSMLLRELGKIRRDEISASIAASKRIIAESKKLCQREESAAPSARKVR